MTIFELFTLMYKAFDTEENSKDFSFAAGRIVPVNCIFY